jgi:hypothetical protein
MNLREMRAQALGVLAGLALLLVVAPAGARLSAAGGQAGGCAELVSNGGFEDGHVAWVEQSKLQMELLDPFYPHTGKIGAWLGGANYAEDSLTQAISLPADSAITLRYWWAVFSEEPAGGVFDTARSELLRPNGSVISTTLTIDNEIADAWLWNEAVADLSAYAGQTVQLRLIARNDATNPTNFFFDDVSIIACPQTSAPTPTPTVTPTSTETLPPRLFLPILLR